jgi:hypothetical protein
MQDDRAMNNPRVDTHFVIDGKVVTPGDYVALKRQLNEVVELALCEQDSIVLKADQLYVFRVVPSCQKCMILWEKSRP